MLVWLCVSVCVCLCVSLCECVYMYCMTQATRRERREVTDDANILLSTSLDVGPVKFLESNSFLFIRVGVLRDSVCLLVLHSCGEFLKVKWNSNRIRFYRQTKSRWNKALAQMVQLIMVRYLSGNLDLRWDWNPWNFSLLFKCGDILTSMKLESLGTIVRPKKFCFRRTARVRIFYDATRPQTRKYFLPRFSMMKFRYAFINGTCITMFRVCTTLVIGNVLWSLWPQRNEISNLFKVGVSPFSTDIHSASMFTSTCSGMPSMHT